MVSSRETIGERSRTHGMFYSPEYKIWATMIQRCTNPNKKMYYRYGGRGISVCNEWRKFENFYSDMGLRPSNKHSIERKDRDGNYEPSNCIWATVDVQVLNKSNNRIIDHNGIRDTIKGWSRRTGINYQTLMNRINRGWTPERALEEKIGNNHGRNKHD